MSDDIDNRDDETEDMFGNEEPAGRGAKKAEKVVRIARETETREAEERPRTWRPVSRLPEPNPREGWVHYWRRRSLQNDVDTVNISRALQEGWEFCKPEDYPEFGDVTRHRSEDRNTIEFGGLVLMRMPQEMADARRAYYENRAMRQISGVQTRLNESASSSKLAIHNRSRTEVKKTPF